MRRIRALWLVLGIGCLFMASASARADDVRESLVVQTAMREARAALAQGDAASAVQLLEAHLTRSGGHLGYLHLLAQAYQAQIQHLQQSGRPDAAEPLLQRLAILQGSGNGPRTESTSPAAAAGDGTNPVVRGASPSPSAAADALRLADQQFLAKNYDKAALFYRQAHDLNRDLPLVSRERWAYCLLHEATERLNANEPFDADGLAKQVRFALALAPRLEFGRKVLDELAKRQPAPLAPGKARSDGVLRSGRDAQGWDVVESAHFKLFHRGYAHAERLLEVAEQTRAAVARKWLAGDQTLRWSVPCEIYLHVDGAAYAQATGQSPQSPGHMSLHAEKNDASRVYGRRIDLQATHPYLLDAVLPHETTHVVLADQFGRHYLPRWADEGLAVLSEPYERIGRHLQGLATHYEQGRAFNARDLLHLRDYPEPNRMGTFYGQSVCLIQFLTEQRGPQTVVTFLRAALDHGYDSALQTYYGMTIDDLDRKLRQYIEAGTPGLTASR